MTRSGLYPGGAPYNRAIPQSLQERVNSLLVSVNRLMGLSPEGLISGGGAYNRDFTVYTMMSLESKTAHN